MTKFQNENQLKGRFGELLAAFAFPPEWVVRPIPDDYGLDLELEVFHALPSESGEKKYQTRGEHLYLQVKTTDKFTFAGQDNGDGSSAVLKFSLETSTLRLVEAMGASVPVVLLVVDRAELKVFYVCLNDYISKTLASSKPTWREQKDITLKIPVKNQIKVTDTEFNPLPHWGYFARLAQRSKIYSAANLLHHFSIELEYCLDKLDAARDEATSFHAAAVSFVGKVQAFTQEIEHLDIWRGTDDEWGAIGVYRENLNTLRDRTEALETGLETFASSEHSPADIESLAFHFTGRAQFVVGIFGILANLGRDYETIARLERLPGDDPFSQ